MSTPELLHCLSNPRLTAVNSSLPPEHLTPSATSTAAPLTKANLRQLEKMTKSGSKSGSNSLSSKTGKTTTTTCSPSGGLKSISTTDYHIKTIQFRANGGLSAIQSELFPPSNQEDIRAYLDRSRDSASPTSSQHIMFVNSLESASSKRDVEHLHQGLLLKDTNKTDTLQDIDYGANLGKQWVAYPKNVGFNHGLLAPKPDLVEGYAQRAFPPSVAQLGGSATLIHHKPTFVSLPHFAAEFKDYGGDMREAEVLTGYDGAHMVYSRNKALAFIDDMDPPRRASPVTVASDGHSWTAYSHYAHHNDSTDKVEYYQVCCFLLTLHTFQACMAVLCMNSEGIKC